MRISDWSSDVCSSDLGELVAVHAAAIVAHRDEALAAVAQGDLGAPGAGVDGVLHQLLDGGGRPLDHLAGGDAVDQIGGQQTEGHGVLRLAPRTPESPARGFGAEVWKEEKTTRPRGGKQKK